jgi:hypothetical protein
VPGLKFPIKRDGLIRLAESFRNEFQNKYHKTVSVIEHPLHVIKKLPHNRVYKDKESLSNDLIAIASKDNELYKNHFISDGTPKYAGCYFDTFDSPNIDYNEKSKSHTMELLNFMAQTELESKKRELEKWQPNSKEDLKFKELELKKIAESLTYRPSSLNSLLNQPTMTQSPQQSGQAQQSQWPYKEDSSKPRLRKDETLFPFYVPGFTFPTTKEKLIQYLDPQNESGKRGIELIFARGLPDDRREYNKEELTGELSRVARHKGETTTTEVSSGKTMKIAGITIITEPFPHHLAHVKEKEKPTVS